MSSATERVEAALRERGIEPAIKTFDASTRTAEDAAAAIGTSVPRIVKSLVFLADDQAVLVLVSGSNRVDTERLGRLLRRRILRADPERVQRETGFAIGGIPPIGHSTRLPTYIDADLLQFDEVWAAAGTAHAVFPISPDELVEITGAAVVDIKV
jgi:Cys-tRNA(Pro) deacylase